MSDPRSLVDRLRTVSPCETDWNSMTGTNRTRFCSHCSLSVHDISAMTRRDVVELVRASKGRLCLRIERDPHGRVRTLDAAPIVTLVRRPSRLAASAMTVALAAGVMAPGALAAPPAPAVVAARSAEPSSGGGSVHGTVLDPTGAVIAGVDVKVSNTSGLVAQTKSDAEGVYHVDLPDGAYLIEVTTGGFKSTMFADVQIRAGETTPLDVTLEVAGLRDGFLGLVALDSAAHELVWHTEERDALGWEDVERPSLAEAEDLAAALRETRDVDSRDKFGDTALMYVASGSVENVRLLLKAGADPNAVDMYGATPLMRAVLYDDVPLVKELIDAGANVNATDSARFTPLMAAAYSGCEDVVKLLIASGADVRAMDARGETPLSYAKKEHEKKIVKRLRAAGAMR